MCLVVSNTQFQNRILLETCKTMWYQFQPVAKNKGKTKKTTNMVLLHKSKDTKSSKFFFQSLQLNCIREQSNA